MPINVKDGDCPSSTTAGKFGLIDNQNSTPAFISYDEKDRWNAIVINQSKVHVTFTAIDHCIDIRRNDGNMERMCDGMLSYIDNIIFVELKTGGSGWMSDGIGQLETTIENFKKENDLNSYRKRRAVVANIKHPNFRVIQNEDKQRFYSKYKVRLQVEAIIML